MIKETMETKETMKNETTTETAVEKKPVTKKVAKKAVKTPDVKKEAKPVKVKKVKPLRTANKWKVRKEVADALIKEYGFGPAVGAIDIVTTSDQIVAVLVNEIPYWVNRESGAVYVKPEIFQVEDTPEMNEDAHRG
jgi:hypothetical protein